MNVTIGFRIFSNKTCSLWQINRYYFNAFSSRQLTAWADFATFLPSFSHSQNSDLQTSWQQLYCRNSHMCLVTTAVLSHFSHMSRDNSWTVTLLTRVSWQQMNCRTSHTHTRLLSFGRALNLCSKYLIAKVSSKCWPKVRIFWVFNEVKEIHSNFFLRKTRGKVFEVRYDTLWYSAIICHAVLYRVSAFRRNPDFTFRIQENRTVWCRSQSRCPSLRDLQ